MSQQFEETLYHGTISEIRSVNVYLGRGRKDFGRGFYMAVSKEQAIGMMHKKYREAVRRSLFKDENAFHQYLYKIKIDIDYLTSLRIKIFETADFEWLNFILLCRENGGVPHCYDVVIGPTADDDTILCLKSYWDGLYGKAGTDAAKQILLGNLEPENLGIQYYVGNQKVADRLIKEISEIDWE